MFLFVKRMTRATIIAVCGEACAIIRSQEVIIICMRSNKIPENGLALPCTYSSIAFIYSHRIPGFFLVNALKVKAWVKGILFKNAIGVDCLFLHITW